MSSDSAQHTLFGLYEDSLTDLVLLSQPSRLQNCSVVPHLETLTTMHDIILNADSHISLLPVS